MTKTRKETLSKADIPSHFFSKFLPELRPVKVQGCQHPGCSSAGDYRAPARHYREEVCLGPINLVNEKPREASRWFCLEHVRAYNASWNYYEGMDQQEMEAAIRYDGVWNRPTWRFGQWGPGKEKPGTRRSSFAKAGKTRAQNDDAKRQAEEELAPLLEAAKAALAELELAPPVEFAEVKKRYRLLVKQHHPDAQAGGDSERIKRLNAAFTLLKSFYARREKD
ncbi:MAG TPA: DnaJ domain-containing protein [Alphaproteobacteria bacterium]|nr:DnaJ domain-containing protein [Alphaproteobacteria bacterium]